MEIQDLQVQNIEPTLTLKKLMKINLIISVYLNQK